MEKSIAVFDLDGTLFDGNAGIKFGEALVQNGNFDMKVAAEIYTLYKEYSANKSEKSEIVDQIYNRFASGMKGQSVDEIKLVAESTWQDIRGNLFNYAAPLINKLGKYGYIALLISGSPKKISIEAAKDLGIDHVIAGQLETSNGIYTGNKISYLGSSEQKVDAL